MRITMLTRLASPTLCAAPGETITIDRAAGRELVKLNYATLADDEPAETATAETPAKPPAKPSPAKKAPATRKKKPVTNGPETHRRTVDDAGIPDRSEKAG